LKKHSVGDQIGLYINEMLPRSPVLNILMPETNSVFSLIMPRIYYGLTDYQVKYIDKLNFKPSIPPWIFSIITNIANIDFMNNFDSDPIIESISVSERIENIISNISGVKGNKESKYHLAKKELINAIDTINTNNEDKIHEVVNKYPWIIVDENKISSFIS
jgi:hypothetical protein